MIKAIIIEDESYIRKGLMALLDSIEQEIMVLGECGTVKEAVTVVKACKPDLVFLDINLPDGNAFDFIEQTSELRYKIVFITAYNEYALKALKAGAVDYILKPVDVEELKIAVDKVIAQGSSIEPQTIAGLTEQLTSDRLVLSLEEGYQVVHLKELMYCQSDKGYTTFYLTGNRSIMASKTIKHFEAKLPPTNFTRTHQSCIVNLDYVDRYDKGGYVVLKGGTEIPVSFRKKEKFLAHLLNKH